MLALLFCAVKTFSRDSLDTILGALKNNAASICLFFAALVLPDIPRDISRRPGISARGVILFFDLRAIPY